MGGSVENHAEIPLVFIVIYVMNRASHCMGGSVENHEEIPLVFIVIYVTSFRRPKGKIITVRNKDNNKAGFSS
jgi:hypothetical protein